MDEQTEVQKGADTYAWDTQNINIWNNSIEYEENANNSR